MPGFDAVIPELPHPRKGELNKEPLHALYRRSCLSVVTARLAAGDRQMVSVLPYACRIVAPDEIRDFDPDFRSFFKCEHARGLARAEELLAGELSGKIRS